MSPFTIRYAVFIVFVLQTVSNVSGAVTSGGTAPAFEREATFREMLIDGMKKGNQGKIDAVVAAVGGEDETTALYADIFEDALRDRDMTIFRACLKSGKIDVNKPALVRQKFFQIFLYSESKIIPFPSLECHLLSMQYRSIRNQRLLFC
jgi:hypothetical protein